MKYILLFTLMLMTSATEISLQEGCFPDKGVKTARTYGEYISGEKLDGFLEVRYDEKGRPLYKGNSLEERNSRFVYRDGKLLYIIQESKASDFTSPQLESSAENHNTRIDTGYVLSYTQDGRPSEMTEMDGNVLYFEYKGCEVELQTFLMENGDTLQQMKLIYKDGVLRETIWSPFNPKEPGRISTYFGYTFNRKGHWIKRQYKHQGHEIVTEKRKLTYY